MKDKYLTNRDYTLRGGKDAAISNNRQKMEQAEHGGKNEFVKREQMAMKSMVGKAPMMEDRYYKFDACQMNDGMHAQEFARDITKGLDKKAFPVK